MKKTGKNKSKTNGSDKFNFDNDYFIGVSGGIEPSKERKKKENENNKLVIKNKKTALAKTKKKSKSIAKRDTKKTTNPTVNKIRSKKMLEQEKKKSKRRKFIRFLCLLFIILITLIIVFVSPIFGVKEIEIKNNHKIASKEIKNVSGIETNSNIFLLSKDNIINTILKSEPYVESVKITKKIPNKLVIEIVERTPSLQVRIDESTYAYINSQGYILEYSETKLEMPVVTNTRTDFESLRNLKETTRLNEEDLNSLGIILKVMSVMKDYDLDSYIVGFDVSDIHDLQIRLNQKNKLVHLGDCSDITTRILYLKKILEDTKDEKGEIFINGNLNEDYVYFREEV